MCISSRVWIGETLFVCAATLYQAGISIEVAKDAAIALRSSAGSFATVLFGEGLLGGFVVGGGHPPKVSLASVETS